MRERENILVRVHRQEVGVEMLLVSHVFFVQLFHNPEEALASFDMCTFWPVLFSVAVKVLGRAETPFSPTYDLAVDGVNSFHDLLPGLGAVWVSERGLMLSHLPSVQI